MTPPAPAQQTGRARGHAGAGEVRIIGGQWKRTRLAVVDRPGLRPTPDRVRETLFNWLGQDLTGWCCIDVFAGTGALGFEAASRGAAEVLIWEHDAQLIVGLNAIRERLGAKNVRIERTDGLAALRSLAPESCDLIFLDPPFDAGSEEPALGAASAAIRAGGRIYLESPSAWLPKQLASFGLHALRHLRAGNVHAHLLTRA